MIETLIDKGLTKGEARVVELLLKGWSNQKIADALFLSEKSIKFHLTKVYRKFNAKSRTQLIVKLLVPDPNADKWSEHQTTGLS